MQARQDDPAVKDPVHVHGVDSDRRPGVDDDARRRKYVALDCAAACRDERRPTIGAELRWICVSIDDSRGFSAGSKPLDRQTPTRELAFDANAGGLTGDIDADGAGRPRKVLPIANGQCSELRVGDNALPDPAAGTDEPPL